MERSRKSSEAPVYGLRKVRFFALLRSAPQKHNLAPPPTGGPDHPVSFGATGQSAIGYSE